MSSLACRCRNPLARCGLDLRLAQEKTPDRPSADLESGTKGGGMLKEKEVRTDGNIGGEGHVGGGKWRVNRGGSK